MFIFFFFNDTATTEIYTLSLHDALPIWGTARRAGRPAGGRRGCRTGSSCCRRGRRRHDEPVDRKSTRLNSSHMSISYAVFCLKKKKNIKSLLFVYKYIELCSKALRYTTA